MSAQHIEFNDQINHGRDIRRALNQLQEGRQNLIDVIATLQLMIDGDSSQDAQYTMMTTLCGFPDNATSHAAWNELAALNSKFTDNSQSNVMAAMLQAFAKFG